MLVSWKREERSRERKETGMARKMELKVLGFGKQNRQGEREREGEGVYLNAEPGFLLNRPVRFFSGLVWFFLFLFPLLRGPIFLEFWTGF